VADGTHVFPLFSGNQGVRVIVIPDAGDVFHTIGHFHWSDLVGAVDGVAAVVQALEVVPEKPIRQWRRIVMHSS
jgi:hypothetical protein